MTTTTRVANAELIGSYFESLSDPRHTRNRKHRLVDNVVIAVCGSAGPTATDDGSGLARVLARQCHLRPNVA